MEIGLSVPIFMGFLEKETSETFKDFLKLQSDFFNVSESQQRLKGDFHNHKMMLCAVRGTQSYEVRKPSKF